MLEEWFSLIESSSERILLNEIISFEQEHLFPVKVECLKK